MSSASASDAKPNGHKPHVVVIGGGFGGLRVAQHLSKAPVEITLIDAQNHFTFQPLLYQVATAALSPANIAYPIRTIFRKQENCSVVLGMAKRVDTQEKEVHLDDGTHITYDYLVVAAGAKTNYFGHDDWALHGLGLKNVDDAVEIRRRVLLAFEAAEREPDDAARARLMTFVVIGGGPSGVEIAGALSELSARVLSDDFKRIRYQKPRIVLVEAQSRLLAGGFHDKLGEKAKQGLEEMGVELRLDTPVEDIDEMGVTVKGGYLPSATVMWTAGVSARTIAKNLGAETDRGGRIIVGKDFTVPTQSDVYAIGDIASYTPEGAERPLPGVAPVAMQAGRYVAKHISAKVTGWAAPEFKYRDKGSMATVGKNRAVVSVWKINMSGFLAWITWLAVHICYLIGFRSRFIVISEWAWTYFSSGRGACLITGDKAWERAVKLSQIPTQHPISTALPNVPVAAQRISLVHPEPDSATVPSAHPPDGEAKSGGATPTSKRAAGSDS